MKKLISILFSVILLSFIYLSSASASNNQTISIFYNGDQLYPDIDPIAEDGTTLVEFRTLFNSLGLEVTWDAKTKKVTGKKEDLQIELSIGSNIAYINEKKYILSKPVKALNGRTLVPLRFVSEATGADVKWDGLNRIISILDFQDKLPSFNLNEIFNENNIDVTIEKVEYFKDDLIGKRGFNIYFNVFNNSNTVLENLGDFKFKSFSSLDNKINVEKDYIVNFNLHSKIFPKEKISGYYTYYFKEGVNEEIKIKEIQYFNKMNVNESWKPIATWLIQEKISNEISNNKLTTLQELRSFLDANYSYLETIIGKTSFIFDIIENTSVYIGYDYWIQVEYEYNYFEGAMNSIKYTPEQKQILYDQLKEHQKNLAEAVIEAMPEKKFYGGYYDSWYRYPNLKLDLQTRKYFSWTNYEKVFSLNEYYLTTPSTFRWYNNIDDYLLHPYK